MIAEVKASPFFKKLDYSSVGTDLVGKRLSAYLKEADKGTEKVPADQEALKFYLYNHVFQVIESDGDAVLTPVRRKLLESYTADNYEILARAFYYLYIVCAREIRHINSYTSYSGSDNMYDKVKASQGEAVADFIREIAGSNSGTVVSLIKKGKPGVTMGPLTKGFCECFYKGSWGGGYGGPAWGNVADCLHSYVTGTISAEVMLDTIWTLAHNNGPIFNKPYLYTGYSGDLIAILDVQRSGQIPQLLSDYYNDLYYFGANDCVSAVSKIWFEISQKFPDARLTGNLDWFKVEALGAVGNYMAYKSKQKNYGVESAYADKAAKIKMLTEKQKKKEEIEKNKTVFVVDHLTTLKKLTRKEAHDGF